MAKQATITEIARKAGVSIGTVDRVLHHRGGVSSESRRRVQAILDEVPISLESKEKKEQDK